MKSLKLNNKEIKTILLIGSIFIFRMLSIFMMLPILSIYGRNLKDSNEFLIGLAIGIYGLMQAVLQIPFGILSDKFGHRKIIILGLTLFLSGSIIVSLTHNIWGLIIGRTLQGSGAISASILALLFQLIREKNITKSMAFIGSSFGLIFAISLVLGPLLTNLIGFNGIFFIISILTLLSIIFVMFIPRVSSNNIIINKKSIAYKNILYILKNNNLIKLNLSIFFLHTILMSNFIIWPLIIIKSGIEHYNQWKIYCSVMLISIFIILPTISYFEKKELIKHLFIFSIINITLSEILFLLFNENILMILLGIQLFFISFNILETILPSLVSKNSDPNYKGTITSIYTTYQFLGIACGGIIGGFIFQLFNFELIFFINILISIIWSFIIFKFDLNSYFSIFELKIQKQYSDKMKLKKLLLHLKNQNGIILVNKIPKKLIINLKINKNKINKTKIKEIISEFSK